MERKRVLDGEKPGYLFYHKLFVMQKASIIKNPLQICAVFFQKLKIKIIALDIFF